jgi:hypothetical protein
MKLDDMTEMGRYRDEAPSLTTNLDLHMITHRQ